MKVKLDLGAIVSAVVFGVVVLIIGAIDNIPSNWSGFIATVSAMMVSQIIVSEHNTRDGK